jgi:hypothetical protein
MVPILRQPNIHDNPFDRIRYRRFERRLGIPRRQRYPPSMRHHLQRPRRPHGLEKREKRRRRGLASRNNHYNPSKTRHGDSIPSI